MRNAPSKMKAGLIQAELQTERFGKSILFMQKVDSTNDLAKELAQYGASEGTVVIAGTQTNGRGRCGRHWVSPKGGLWFSIIMRPRVSAREAARLVFITGLSVARTLRGFYGLQAEIKWPNDVTVNGKKMCGTLVETNTVGQGIDFVVVGVGVNANFLPDVLPQPLKGVATSIEKELGRKVQLEELFRALLQELESAYDQYITDDSERLLQEWRRCANFLGNRVEVTSNGETQDGVAQDVDSEGALILRTDDGRIHRILVGDVSLRTKLDSCRSSHCNTDR